MILNAGSRKTSLLYDVLLIIYMYISNNLKLLSYLNIAIVAVYFTILYCIVNYCRSVLVIVVTVMCMYIHIYITGCCKVMLELSCQGSG